MILEVAILNVRVGLEREFEAAFAQGSLIIASMPGYISHQLQRCVETSNRYALLVNWTSIEAHTIGFRGSPEYQRWKQLLHHFYDPSDCRALCFGCTRCGLTSRGGSQDRATRSRRLIGARGRSPDHLGLCVSLTSVGLADPSRIAGGGARSFR